MAKTTLTYEFDSHEERAEFMHVIRSQDAYSVLWDIDQELRSKMKYSDEDWLNDTVVEYLDEIRSMIFESGVLKDD